MRRMQIMGRGVGWIPPAQCRI